MTKTTEPVVVVDGLVVSLDYRLHLDSGEQVDDSEDEGPLEFLQGHGHIIPGLEQAIYGMAVGDEKDIVVAPTDGYGEHDPEAFEEVPTSAFPADLKASLEVGMPLQTQDESGDVLVVYVSEVRPDNVLIDLNHPLAGETLHFWAKVVGLREATSEEMAHGHVHGAAHTESE